MIKLVFMVEEPSMEECLKNIIPVILDGRTKEFAYIIIPHEGKNDLEKSIPVKLQAFKNYPGMIYKFIILRDQDNGDCIAIKNRIKMLCKRHKRKDCLIRIVCQELESWFLGDFGAISKSCDEVNAEKFKKKAKFRNPDKLANPSQEINKIFKNRYKKVEHARRISKHLNLLTNNSHSFNIFISGVSQIINH